MLNAQGNFEEIKYVDRFFNIKQMHYFMDSYYGPILSEQIYLRSLMNILQCYVQMNVFKTIFNCSFLLLLSNLYSN